MKKKFIDIKKVFMNYVQSIILENENIHIFFKLKKVLQLKCNKDKICIKLLAKKKLGTILTVKFLNSVGFFILTLSSNLGKSSR